MAVTINASTTSGLVMTSDLSGTLTLQSNGTTVATASSSGLAISTYNPSASLITSGTAVASTSGTSIDFTSIPSWVKRITVMFNGVSTNGSSNYLVQIGAGSVTTSGYLGSSSLIGASSVSSAAFTTGFGVNQVASGTAFTFTGNLTLTTLGSNIWTASGVIARTDGAGTMTTSGNITLSGTLDRVRITTVNGTDTFDAGSINILYE